MPTRPPEKTRLTTFYESRTRKAVEGLRAASRFAPLVAEVETALAGLQNSFALVAGDDLEKCSLELHGSRRYLPGGDVSVPRPRGLGGLVEALAADLKIVFNRRVRVIDWSLVPRDARLVDKLVVECEATKEGGSATLEEYYADFVISTLPMAVLKQCHNSMFYPALDEEKVQVLKTIGCGHAAKIHLEWADPWWAQGKGGVTLAWNRAEMTSRILPRDWPTHVSNFSEVAGQPNMLCCWIAGSGARVADTLGEEEVMDELTGLLRKFTGDPGVPRPMRLHRHAWSTDPFSLGSASYPILATDSADFDKLSTPLPNAEDPRLMFAGEATSSAYWSTLHGARMSGLREAERVWEKMKSAERAEDRMDEMLRQVSASDVRAPVVRSKLEQMPGTATRNQNGIATSSPMPNGLLKMRKKIMAESSIPRGGIH